MVSVFVPKVGSGLGSLVGLAQAILDAKDLQIDPMISKRDILSLVLQSLHSSAQCH